MFTGIIQELGKVKSIEEREEIKTFTIEAAKVLKGKDIGDSIAVNGACMTITDLSPSSFKFDAIKESLEKTNLKTLEVGSIVNLEPAMRLEQTVDGHLVQGHVDCTSEVFKIIQEGENTVISIKIPKEMKKYLAFKGSITVNGVSLTVARLEENSFNVAIIPHTMAATNFQYFSPGEVVNLEADLIARYLESLFNAKEEEATYQFLKERNLI